MAMADGLVIVTPEYNHNSISVGLHSPTCSPTEFSSEAIVSRPHEVHQLQTNYAPNALSMVPASLTSNLPGASTLTAFTTPSSTNMEQRCERMPMPRPVRPSPNPRSFTSPPLPSAITRPSPPAPPPPPHPTIPNAPS